MQHLDANRCLASQCQFMIQHFERQVLLSAYHLWPVVPAAVPIVYLICWPAVRLLCGDSWPQVLIGGPFYRQAWHGLKYGSANMGLLVALGTTAAFADSLMTMALAAADSSYMGHVYFESSVLILVFVCAGKYIEAKAKARTSDAVRSLLQLGAKTAVLLQLGPDGQAVLSAKEISAELVQVRCQRGVAMLAL